MEAGMHEKIYLIILVMIIATQISRLGPLLVSKKFQMSESFEAWLKYIPVAVLSALIVPEFFQKEGSQIEVNWLYIISAVVAFFVGLKFRNLVLTTFVGVATLVILRILQ